MIISVMLLRIFNGLLFVCQHKLSSYWKVSVRTNGLRRAKSYCAFWCVNSAYILKTRRSPIHINGKVCKSRTVVRTWASYNICCSRHGTASPLVLICNVQGGMTVTNSNTWSTYPLPIRFPTKASGHYASAVDAEGCKCACTGSRDLNDDAGYFSICSPENSNLYIRWLVFGL